MTAAPPTFYTSSDERFFVGTVALVNSLRLTGHDGTVVVFDLGLTEAQRERLGAVASVETPAARDHAPKVLPASDRAAGPVVLLDSDMLVVASLAEVLDDVERGKICAHPDPDERWFDEWRDGFGLSAPLRRERYVNSGFVAFSVDRWPGLLERWAQANRRLPHVRGTRPEHPYRDVDQDALNAVLMSEVPAGSVSVHPAWAHAHPDALPRLRIASERALTCMDGDHRVVILHHSLRPKAWERSGWQRDFRQAYIRLLPRALFWEDVALRLEPEDVPVWLRPTMAGRLASRALGVARAVPGLNRAAKAAIRARAALSRSS